MEFNSRIRNYLLQGNLIKYFLNSKGINLIVKYVLFGFDKIKNEKVSDNEKSLFEFITDLENVSKNCDKILANVAIIQSIRFKKTPNCRLV